MRTGTSVENTKMASQREFLPGHLTIFHGRTKKKAFLYKLSLHLDLNGLENEYTRGVWCRLM